jgi:hypothetical protein
LARFRAMGPLCPGFETFEFFQDEYVSSPPNLILNDQDVPLCPAWMALSAASLCTSGENLSGPRMCGRNVS